MLLQNTKSTVLLAALSGWYWLFQDYTEDYIQIGPGQLYAHSTRLFAVDGVSVPYTWNHTITYDHTKGKMPFLVETLHASSITTEYNPLEETLAFKIHASISKGIVQVCYKKISNNILIY